MLGPSTTGSLKTVATKLAQDNLNLMAVQGVRWVEGGNKPENDYIFLCEMRTLIIT